MTANTISAGGRGVEVLDIDSLFSGGIGAAGTISAGLTGIDVVNVGSFAGGVIATGTISAGQTGIDVFNVGSFSGGISNSGKLTAAGEGIIAHSVAVFGNTGAGGGIVNSGTISAGQSGIGVGGLFTSFSGGISNAASGKIVSTEGIGIVVDSTNTSIPVFGNSSAGGGITNSGTISAHQTGILVKILATFAGGISNGGKLTAAGKGILVDIVDVFGNTDEGIVNSGTISAGQTSIRVGGFITSFSGGISNAASGKIVSTEGIGIFVGSTSAPGGDSSVSGGITNSGSISAHQTGILLRHVTTFAGGISNSGKIAGELGIALKTVAVFGDPNAEGGISNTGTISAPNQGIFVDRVTTFGGTIVNSGKLAAATGISVGNFVFFGASSSGGGITNSGTITASVLGISLHDAANFTGGIANSSVIAAHRAGIEIGNVATLSGGVSNSGRITATTGDGIDVSGVAVFGNGSAGGGIINSGTISAGGIAIDINNTATFAGGIRNSGKIASKRGIGVTDVGVFGDSSDGGGITNAGTMQGGINLRGVETFFGSIVNSSAGKIVSGGINFSSGALFGAGSVAGGITNAGTISVDGGIFVNTATFLGDISNSGKIVAGNGIELNGVAIFGGSNSGGAIVNSDLISAATAGLRLLHVGTLAGGITNVGVISAGKTGVEISDIATLSGGIVNSGAITGNNVGIGVFDRHRQRIQLETQRIGHRLDDVFRFQQKQLGVAHHRGERIVQSMPHIQHVAA
jgi:hypothetical protein